MKKATKAIIAASAVAAVVGVGAVSYAEWKGGAHTDATATGKTATISLKGFDASTITGPTANLLPYDQGSDVGGNVRVWSLELPTITAAEATKLQVNFTESSTLSVYVKWSETTVSTHGVTDTPTAAGYQALSSTPTDLAGAKFNANASEKEAGYLVVILDSSNTSDMNKDIKITVSVIAQ